MEPSRSSRDSARNELPSGFEAIQINLVQLAAMSDESKLMAPRTMESIADSVLAPAEEKEV
jgi:hypothetical protein